MREREREEANKKFHSLEWWSGQFSYIDEIGRVVNNLFLKLNMIINYIVINNSGLLFSVNLGVDGKNKHDL